MSSSTLICIVDDHADYRFLLQQIFDRYLPTYPAEFFDNGQTFLDSISSTEPAPGLILLDQHMPQADGYQILSILKKHPIYSKIPVVMLSAGATAAEINNCYEAGANSFLLKRTDWYEQKQMMEIVCHYWIDLNQVSMNV